MPLYEYQCKKCEAVVVELKKMDDRDKCPKCVTCKRKMKRLFSTPNFNLLGEGFYKPASKERTNEY